MEQTFFGSSRPVMLVDRHLRMVFASREAFERCAQWNFGPHASDMDPRRVFRVPAEIARACERLGATHIPAMPTDEAGDGTCVVHPGMPGLAARIDICLPLEERQAPAGFLVQFVPDRASELPPGAQAEVPDPMRLLSPSERRVALLVANGASNKSVARQLRKSARTVECQMSAIYRKLALLPNRVQLSRLLIEGARW
jgi:DNA-binding CsgD family transcriptional regulator